MRVPQELLTFAKQLRKSQTGAEALMWHLLRDHRLCGYKFRRQFPLAGYILDFYCHTAKLAIELDGGGHNDEEQRCYDQERTRIWRIRAFESFVSGIMMCSMKLKVFWK